MNQSDSVLRGLCALCVLCALLSAIGCDRSPDATVTLYTSIDEPFARPLIKDFEKRTGIKVTLVTDAEASKTVGLVERLRAEKANPQCDVWWGNEPFHTILLSGEGVFEPYESADTTLADLEMQSQFRNRKRLWHCNGLRARVLVTAEGTPPLVRLEQLLDPQLKGRIAMARPTAGTTGGHVAALYVLWGDEQADEFFRALRGNEVKLLGGNSVVAESVGAGAIIAGITDNDDVESARREGLKLSEKIPDVDTIGTLAIPTTIALVRGAKSRDAATTLIEFLASAEVEQRLIKSGFLQCSIRSELPGSGRFRMMNVDYEEVARALPSAVRRANDILEGRQ